MKKCLVDTFIVDGEKTPAYIIAHAQWQKSRGRNPSEHFGLERNPHKALADAYRKLATHRSPLCRVAGEMVILADFTQQLCVTRANGVGIIASPRRKARAVVTFYYEAFDCRAVAHRKSLSELTARTFRC